MGFGARGCAEGGDETAVGVMDQKEADEEELGGARRLGVGWGGCEGCVGERVDQGHGGDHFHDNPGADAVDEENAVGRGSKPAVWGIGAELEEIHKGWYDEEEPSDD